MLSLAGAAQPLKTCILQFVICVFGSLVYIEDYSSISTCIYISFTKMKFVLGYWGVPLLCTGFVGFIALTFEGITGVMIVFIDILTWYSEFDKPAMSVMVT